MIEESADVLEVESGVATVSIQRRSACGSCSASGGCGTALLASWLPQRRLTFELDNRIGAQPGDTVVVGLDERRLQHYALLLYATPLVGLLVGAVSGRGLAGSIGLDPELTSIALGLSGLALALARIGQCGRRLSRRNRLGVRLIRVSRHCADGAIPITKDLVSEPMPASEKGHR